MSDAIQVKDLRFCWPTEETPSLDIAEFVLGEAERVFLCGQSGSGKSTLLNLIAGVLDGQQGELRVLGQDMARLRPSQRDALRAERIGYIFQQFNLLPYLSVLDNLTLPCRLSATRRGRACEKSGSVSAAASALMADLGLPSDLADRPVTALSIGQQQRVAAARALIGGPDLIIADEPTSALDTEHRQLFMQQLLRSCSERQVALLFVSHDPGLKVHFDRIVDMHSLNRSVSRVLD